MHSFLGGDDAGFRTGGPSSMHKLPYVSILFCILRTIYRLCMKNRIYGICKSEIRPSSELLTQIKTNIPIHDTYEANTA